MRTSCVHACADAPDGSLMDQTLYLCNTGLALGLSQLIGRCPVCALSDCTGNTWWCVPCSCTSPAVRKRVSRQMASGTCTTGILWRRCLTATPKQILFGLHFCARARMASPAGQQLCESVPHFQHDVATLVRSGQGCTEAIACCPCCLMLTVQHSLAASSTSPSLM